MSYGELLYPVMQPYRKKVFTENYFRKIFGMYVARQQIFSMNPVVHYTEE